MVVNPSTTVVHYLDSLLPLALAPLLDPISSALPQPSLFLSIVRESVHPIYGGEGIVEVREDVEGGEEDRLAPTPVDLAEEKI